MGNGIGEEVVEGGPWTRVDPATGKGSCLDLFIINKELRPFVKSLVIDSERKLTAARVVTTRGARRLTYSDHFSCLLTFQNIPKRRTEHKRKETKWNLALEGGWKKYKEECDKFSDKLVNIVEDETTSIEDAMEKFAKMHDKIKYKSFGKVTIKENKLRKGDN